MNKHHTSLLRFVSAHLHCALLAGVCLFPVFASAQTILEGASTEGKDFWVTLMRADADNPTELSLRFATKEDATIRVENTYTGFDTTLTLTANTLGTLVLDKQDCYVGTNENMKVSNHALHITATANISLIAANYRDKSFDVAAILPTASLKNEYRMQCYTPADHENNYQGSHFAIVATEDNTIVDYVPTIYNNYQNSTEFTEFFTKWNGKDTATFFEQHPQFRLYQNYKKIGDTLSTPVLMKGGGILHLGR